MKLDFLVWLKLAIGRFLEPKAQSVEIAQIEERDRSAREYEFYYWGTMPGLWY